MGICSAKLDTSTPEGKLRYIFQHFDQDSDAYLCEAEYISFALKMGNKMFYPDGWDSALAEYGQGWVCDSNGGIPYDGILMMCAYERGALPLAPRASPLFVSHTSAHHNDLRLRAQTTNTLAIRLCPVRGARGKASSTSPFEQTLTRSLTCACEIHRHRRRRRRRLRHTAPSIGAAATRRGGSPWAGGDAKRVYRTHVSSESNRNLITD